MPFNEFCVIGSQILMIVLLEWQERNSSLHTRSSLRVTTCTVSPLVSPQLQLVSRGQTVFAPRAENGLGNDVTSFCSGYPRNFWEINEARKGVNIVARIPMVSSITCNNHMERTMTQWLYITIDTRLSGIGNESRERIACHTF